FHVQVTATDGVGNVGQEQNITVSLNKLNDTAPVVTTDTGSFNENANGTVTPVVVTALSATDADNLASDQPITFAVTGGTDASKRSGEGPGGEGDKAREGAYQTEKNTLQVQRRDNSGD